MSNYTLRNPFYGEVDELDDAQPCVTCGKLTHTNHPKAGPVCSPDCLHEHRMGK